MIILGEQDSFHEVCERLFGIRDGSEFTAVRLLKTKREPRMNSRTG